MNTIEQEFELLMRSVAEEVGMDVSANMDVAKNMAKRMMKQLAAVYNEPGYVEALISARNIVAIELGVSTVTTADFADQRMLGAIHSAVGMGARLLVAAI